MQHILRENASAPPGPQDRSGSASLPEGYSLKPGGGCPRVVAIRDVSELMSHLPALEDLASAAAEPNVFYEPWMLLPAIRSFGRGADFIFVLIYSSSAPHEDGWRTKARTNRASSSPQKLIGFFPLERVGRYRKLPVSVLRLWRHSQCGFCSPLVRRGLAPQAISTFFDWVYSSNAGSHLIEFELIDGEGDFARTLKQYLADNSLRHFQADCFSRALFAPACDAESYLKQASGKRHRKDMARRLGRLAAAGQLEFAMLTDPAQITFWTSAFLDLEAGGWKGRNGTALASIAGGRSFLTYILLEAFARNRLMMLGIKLDGKLIAAKCNLLAGTGSFAFKIAYDETYADFSPGLLLEVENIRRLHAIPHVQWMDSCAAPRHPMIDHLWPGRRMIETILVPGAKASGSLIIAALPLLRLIKRKLAQSHRRQPGHRSDPAYRRPEASPESHGRQPADHSDPAYITAGRTIPMPNHLTLNRTLFTERFGRAAFAIDHDLAHHPLFSLERLLELSKALPASNVKYNSGQVEIGAGVYRGPATGLSIQETIRQIEQCGAWMVLKFVELDPEYRKLLDTCLDQVAIHSNPIEPGMCRREGFIFISSPGSITPYHIDPEYNFLLQIRGAKTINVLDGADRSILSEAEIENFFSGRKHQIAFDELYLNKATSVVLEPGKGIHVPPAAPHWVHNGGDVCVSFSITFRTPALERRALIYGANSRLRRLGLDPSPPGSSRVMDSAKYLGYRALRRTGSFVRPILRTGAVPPPNQSGQS